MKNCPFCAEEIQDAAVKCRHCGEMLQTDASLPARPSPNPVSTKTASDVVGGTATGCASGLAFSGCLLPVGILLCCTGIGAIVGIPLILMAVAAPFTGSLMGFGFIKGPCPYCGAKVSNSAGLQGFNCTACKQRILIRDKEFYRVGDWRESATPKSTGNIAEVTRPTQLVRAGLTYPWKLPAGVLAAFLGLCWLVSVTSNVPQPAPSSEPPAVAAVHEDAKPAPKPSPPVERLNPTPKPRENGLQQQLRIAVMQRYPGKEVTAYNIVPYETQRFAITKQHGPDRVNGYQFSNRDLIIFAVWEFKAGQWSWIFDYTPNYPDTDSLYRQNRFSVRMRNLIEDGIHPFP